MLQLLNFKWDKRTIYNVLFRLPVILCVRIWFVPLIWFLQWLTKWMEYAYEAMPGWEIGPIER